MYRQKRMLANDCFFVHLKIDKQIPEGAPSTCSIWTSVPSRWTPLVTPPQTLPFSHMGGLVGGPKEPRRVPSRLMGNHRIELPKGTSF